MKSMTDSALLEHVGRALYGDLWKQALADDLGISRSYVYALVKQRRELSEAVRLKLVEFAASMPARLYERQAEHLRVLASLQTHLRTRWS